MSKTTHPDSDGLGRNEAHLIQIPISAEEAFSVENRRMGMPETRTLKERLYSLFCESDMVPVKFTLMCYALFQGVGFLFASQSCLLLACLLLEDTMPYWVWATFFLIYAFSKAWRIIDGRHRPLAARIINTYGALLFGTFATVLLVARWPYWFLAVPYIVVALVSIWVFARTAINPGRGFRGE